MRIRLAAAIVCVAVAGSIGCASPGRLRPASLPSVDARGVSGPAYQLWVGSLDVVPHPRNDDGEYPEYAVFVTRIGVPEADTIRQLRIKKESVRKSLEAFRRENPAPPDDASDEAKVAYRNRIGGFIAETRGLDRRIADAAAFVSSSTDWLPAPNTATTLYYNRLIPLRVYRGDTLEIRVDEVDPVFSETMGRLRIDLDAERLALGLTLRNAYVTALEIQFRQVNPQATRALERP